MKVINVKELKNTYREVYCPNKGFISNRIILKKDNMGFGLNHTFIPKGKPQNWHYKNHLEACYCVSGKGILIDCLTDEKYNIEQGVTYILDKNDNHIFKALEDTVLICVFNPPLIGSETHNDEGSYSIGEENV